jgi:hypothetical protein
LQQIKSSNPTLEKPFDLDRIRGFVQERVSKLKDEADPDLKPSDDGT